MPTRLSELIKTVQEMDQDELLALVREVRSDRRVSKKIQRTTTKASRVKSKDKLRDALKAMSPEERKAFLEKI